MRQLPPRYGVHWHAYVLMTNHLHLLMTPDEKEPISNLLKVVGSRYAQCFYRKYNRTGALWEGRHKSSDVDSENYLLKCYF
jgi:putative transposase